jgi:lipopolysaccharide transport system ATP-binding protein
VEHLSKTYRLGAIGGATLQQDFARWWARMRSRPDPLAKIGALPSRQVGTLFRALEDVSFEVQEGEVLGIIGRNGAGKSTLLKILSQVTAPTSGRVVMHGRVASLLEVGTGFHPELTGRENVYLNGAILGMTRAEIRSKFDEIVEFSECATFIDTPVKRYSSGMYVRLAFAVAAHLEPEILIVDEVLAVGDAQFQQKCIGKMQEVGRAGRTILFVSHQLGSVQRLCSRAVLMEGGQVAMTGDVSRVVERYLAGAPTSNGHRRNITVNRGEAKIVSWRVVNSGEGGRYSCLSRENCCFELEIDCPEPIPPVHISFVVWALSGELIIAGHSMDSWDQPLRLPPGISHVRVSCRLPLKTGQYQMDFALADGEMDHWLAEPLLNILPNDSTRLPQKWKGLLNEPVTFSTH